jgi:hypothetical protein
MNNVELTAEIAKLHNQVDGIIILIILSTVVNFFLFLSLPVHFVEKKKS